MALLVIILLLSTAALSDSSLTKRAKKSDEYSYLGCYISTHALNFFAFKSESMTPPMCARECAQKGNDKFGMNEGSQCFCGDTKLQKSDEVKTACTIPCTGNFYVSCGSSYAMDVYKVPKHEAPLIPAPHVGCYLMNEFRSVLHMRGPVSKRMTHRYCASHCLEYSRAYFGLFNGRFCYCGDEIREASRTSDNLCRKRCPGNRREKCGGINGMAIFKVKLAT